MEIFEVISEEKTVEKRGIQENEWKYRFTRVFLQKKKSL